MHDWSPELVVDEARARRLIAENFPDLEVRSLELLAEGWDNAVWLANDGLAFRFPQREMGVRGIERELAVLPRLAALLPFPVPVPTHRGHPVDDYPWPFFGFRLIPGREAAQAALDDDARIRLARPLARFLRVLHDHGAKAVEEIALPVDPLGRADPVVRVPLVRERFAELEQSGLGPVPPSAEPLLRAAGDLPPSTVTVLVHGDLHPRHLLVDGTGALTGVIDWGDLCLADPSLDLSIVWSFLPVDGRRAFEEEYGPVAEETQLRARMLALHLTASIAHYAHVEGEPVLAREALGGLARVVAE